MALPDLLKRCLDRAFARRGYERVASRLVYPWQRASASGPSHSGAPIPAAAAALLQPSSPRLLELERRYRALDSPLTREPVWTPEFVATADLEQFRGDNPYVWQLRGRNLNELGYALTYYAVRRTDRLGLLDRLDEDGLFGVHTFTFDGKTVSRDLLDSVVELDFLDRHLDLAGAGRRTILDIGAGYGRLAHRAVRAFPATVRYLCTDAIARSTFLCEFYLDFRGIGGIGGDGPARVVPLPDLEAAIPAGSVDLAVNVHSFSECRPAAINGWLDFLARKRVPQLMVVPNAVDGHGRMLTNEGHDFSAIVEQHGYRLLANEPKFVDPVVQEYGVSPARHLLFRRPD
ncbi:MAG: putative sugar O-methyltransferase [Thermoanaerobaculia bacterium]